MAPPVNLLAKYGGTWHFYLFERHTHIILHRNGFMSSCFFHECQKKIYFGSARLLSAFSSLLLETLLCVHDFVRAANRIMYRKVCTRIILCNSHRHIYDLPVI